MERWVIVGIGVAVVGVVGGVAGPPVFEHFDHAGKVHDAERACTGVDVVVGSPSVPAGFPLPAGQKLLQVQSQGATRIVYAGVPGTRADIVHVRDQVTAQLAKSGYRVTQTDQEPTYEADATVSKAGVDDTVNVRPLCQGQLRVRYVLH